MHEFVFSKDDIKKYLLRRSLLFNKQKTVKDVFDYLGCIQVDPINVVARNHELVLYNRVENFKISDLYKELYEKRSLFEYWMQLFSIIPIESFPYMDLRMNAEEKWRIAYIKVHKAQINAVRDFFKKNGPTAAEDLPNIKAGRTYFSWTNASSKTALLEYLWDTGELMIHHRTNNRKYYDLTERVLPKKYCDKQVTRKEAQLFYIHKNFDYLGIIRKPFINRVGYAKTLELGTAFNEEVKNGSIIQLQIDGVKTKYYTNRKNLQDLTEGVKSNDFKGTFILAPLDPLVIDRSILSDIFNFYYRWEAYTPPRLRKFGFYNMPILMNGEFVGQIALKKDENRILRIETLTFDKRHTKAVEKEVRKELKNLQQFINRD